MVTATRDSAPQTQTNPAPISAEEEALKRNTDCVYFLASPLTCKKGAECEYRHSDYARVNPRDCWYWLNGNCLNPKCAFRHPPLDGLLGNQAAASVGSSFPPVHNVMPVALHASAGVACSSKQAVPCIFFQKGHCLKGDKCAFQHLANPVGNKTQQTSVAAPVSEPPNLAKKAFGSLEKCSQLQMTQPELPKPMTTSVTVKATPKINNVLAKSGAGVEKTAQPFQAVDDVSDRSHASNAAPVHSGNIQSRPSSRMHQSHVLENHSFHNDKEGDEFQRESSPGFDVLVDDELGDSEYYHGEDQYNTSAMGHEENLNSISEYEMDHCVDYNDLDGEPFYDSLGYDSYDRLQGEYRRDSSERIRAGPGYMERRSSKRNGGSPDYVGESDLRHRLSKQRRVNGLRSVVNQDFAPDGHFDGRNSFRTSQRNSQLVSSQEGSHGSRLRGRLKLPHRSPVGGNDLYSDIEMDMGFARGRLRPQRSQGASGRLQGRLKGRIQEDANNEGKNFRGWARKPVMDERSTNFAGPKSLAELKGMKQETDVQELSLVGKQKGFKPLNNQQPANDVSFEGPKPLGEILKRKREAETVPSSSDPLINKEEKSRKEEREILLQNANKEEAKSATVDADGSGDKGWHDQSSHLGNSGEDEYEDNVIHDDAMEENELEENDQRNGEYDYDDQGDGGEYFEEGENAEGDGDDYLDDEDGDDFAKKVGVMFS